MEHIKFKRFSIEQCNESADKFNDAIEWRHNDRPAFTSAKRHGWLLTILKRKGWVAPTLLSKMLLDSKDRLNECVVAQDAKKYSSRKDWQKQSPSIYHYAWRHNLIEKYGMEKSNKWKTRKVARKTAEFA